MEAQELVFETLLKANKPLRPGEIAELSGLDKKEVDKQIKKLQKEERIESPMRCFYAPKK